MSRGYPGGGAARVGRATLRARLYDLGEYPGAVLDDVADGEVFGELWVARYSRDALGALDRYEAYFPARPAESLFLRRRVRVRTPDASTTAWAYVLPRVPPHARPLPAGRWPQA